MPNDQQQRFHGCYMNWVREQEQDLEELVSELNRERHDEQTLRVLIDKVMQHYQSYTEVRAALAKEDSTSLFCPSCNSSFENSYLWIAGCRPSLAIRLLYALSGSELESHLLEYLDGVRRGTLDELSARQLGLVNDLHCKTMREEEKVSSKMARLQVEMSDKPLALMARHRPRNDSDVDRALQTLADALGGLMEEADKLRVETLRDVVDILTPLQAVDLLTAAKQLHLSVHEWGQKRDRQHGRPLTK